MTHTSTEQPEALRLADAVDSFNRGVRSQIMYEEYSAAAAELRRLHAENQELKEQLSAIGAGGEGPLAQYNGCFSQGEL